MYGKKSQRITAPGRQSRVTGFTAKGKPRKSSNSWPSSRNLEWQSEQYQRALQSGKWAS